MWRVLGILLAAVLCPALHRGHQTSPFCVTDVVSCHCGRTNNPGSCPQKGRAFQAFLTKLVRKLFRERETNISQNNPCQYFAVFSTTEDLGFSPLNPWLLFISHFPQAGTVSLQSVLTGFSQDTSKVFSFIQNTTGSTEAFFP